MPFDLRNESAHCVSMSGGKHMRHGLADVALEYSTSQDSIRLRIEMSREAEIAWRAVSAGPASGARPLAPRPAAAPEGGRRSAVSRVRSSDLQREGGSGATSPLRSAAGCETEGKVSRQFIIVQLQARKPGEVNPGSTRCQPGVNLESTWGHPGLNMGSTESESGVNLQRPTVRPHAGPGPAAAEEGDAGDAGARVPAAHQGRMDSARHVINRMMNPRS
jgi:hypothetical protein